MYLCPHVAGVEQLTDQIAHGAEDQQTTGAGAVYLDEVWLSQPAMLCWAKPWPLRLDANVIDAEIAMAKPVRKALDDSGLKSTIVYTECPPVDVGAPYVDGSFTYALPSSDLPQPTV